MGAPKGRIPWNKGLNECYSEETRKRMGAKQGSIPWNKGLKLGSQSEEHNKKRADANRGKSRNVGHIPWNKGLKLFPHSEEHKRKIGDSNKGSKNGFYGKNHTEDSKKKISQAMKGKNCGPFHPAWKGGISFEQYSQHWTDDLKEVIRKRDNYVCQECGIHQDEMQSYKKLDIHHIDYDKHNLDPINLISLCKSCHMKTNYNREYWVKYFNKCMEKGDDNE